MAVISYRNEALRKLIHLSSLWMPIAIYFLDRTWALILFSAALIGMLMFEALRRSQYKPGLFLQNLFQPILRSFESGSRLTGATYMMLAAFICLVIFPREITITALCILILADTAASLVGRRFGKIKIFDKSLEGSAAFFVTASLSVLLLSNLFPNSPHYLLAGLLAAFIATIIEAASTVLRLDDNFSVTMTVGIVMWLAQAVI